MRINLIVAVAHNNVIGASGQGMLWHISADFKYFKQVTTGHPIIMGRKTFVSIGRPLPNRTNIIVTRDQNFTAEGCVVVHSLQEAIEKTAAVDAEDIFIIGGGEIYKEAMQAGIVDRIYITKVDAAYQGDVVFPDYSEYSRVVSSEDHEEDGIRFTWQVLEK